MSLYNNMFEANAARAVEWNMPGMSPLFRATELGGEVGEALNVVKKLERERIGMLGSRASVADLAAELADVMICVRLLAAEYGIDVEKEERKKFNATSEKYGLQTRVREL